MLRTTYNQDSQVFSGRKCPPLFNPEAALGHLLYGNYLSREENSSVVQKWMAVLEGQVEPGEVVNSIVDGLGHDHPELMGFYVASLLHGNPIHFLDHRSGAVEIENAVKVTSAKSIRVSVSEEGTDEGGQRVGKAFSISDMKNPNPVAYFTTAGISGLPKLVPLSAESIIHHLSNPLNSSASALSFQPLSKYRIFLEGLGKLVKGSQIRIRMFSLTTFEEECLEAPFEELHLTNYQLAKIVSEVQSPVETVKQIYCSGCYANPILIRRAKSVFPGAKIVYSYGLTEVGGPVAVNPDAGAKYTVGQLNDNYEVSIRNEQGEKLGYGCQGEIFVRPPVPFEGYFQNPEDTMPTLILDGWCRTGDIGYFDEDLDLHILDRDKEVIIYDCNAISPYELEFYLKKMPEIAGAKVFAVSDVDKGELPAAKIILKNGASSLSKEAVDAFIVSQLGPLKALRGGISFVHTL